MTSLHVSRKRLSGLVAFNCVCQRYHIRRSRHQTALRKLLLRLCLPSHLTSTNSSKSPNRLIEHCKRLTRAGKIARTATPSATMSVRKSPRLQTNGSAMTPAQASRPEKEENVFVFIPNLIGKPPAPLSAVTNTSLPSTPTDLMQATHESSLPWLHFTTCHYILAPAPSSTAFPASWTL